jgi:hypothetical protein
MAPFRGRGFVLADPADVHSRQLICNLSALGFDVDMCGDHDAVMGVFQDAQTAESADCLWTVLVVDLDYLTTHMSIEEIADDLLALRRSVVKLSVIMLSNEVIRRDDSGVTRLPMADVSLQSPVSLKRLRFAVWDARSNNMIWQTQIGERAVSAAKEG